MAKPDIWVDAECWVSTAADPKFNQDGTPGPDWELIGLLNGSDGFGNQREFATTEATAWGKGVVAESEKDFKSTGGMTALEDNAATRYLIWPGSTEHVLVVPKPARVFIAYMTVNQDGDREWLISREKAKVFAPDVSKKDEVAGTAFEITHYADSKGGLFDRLVIDGSTGAVKSLTPIRIEGLTAEEYPLDIKGVAMTPPPVGA